MNKQNWTVLLVALALIGGTSVLLVEMRVHQRLGQPGVKTAIIPGSKRLSVYLPPKVLNYDSVVVPTDTNVLEGLPHDTSFIQRRYFDPTGNLLLCNIVLMGTDRTSIHKPQFCLTGIGWTISDAESSSETVRIERPYPYDLRVMKLVTSPRALKDSKGNTFMASGVYVYWFVADNDLTESHWTRMRHISTHLLATGELERWAYVSCFAICPPGGEEKAYQQIKNFIAASVPEFQLAHGPRVAGEVSPQASLH
jgi:hypothetical protein